jgi:autotransporter strand-loop-strand O-heptosyltransferase
LRSDAGERRLRLDDLQALEIQRAELLEQAEHLHQRQIELAAGLDSAPLIAQPTQPEASADPPTQYGPNGIRYDFNYGARIMLPHNGHPWRVRLIDLDSGLLLYETEVSSGWVGSSKCYAIKFRIEVWQNGERVFVHDYSAAGRNVLIRFPGDALGDSLGWFSYCVKFKERHGCKLTVAMSEKIAPLFRDAYPDIDFVPLEHVEPPEKYYATYHVGLFRDDDCSFRPCDYRLVGLHRIAGYILGVDPTEAPPKIRIEDDSRPIREPYVVIAVQATSQCKNWNNPFGWHEVVRFLKENGYRVICIDRDAIYGSGISWNHIPHDAEDETGDRSLTERARWLKHCEFFVGLASGLSWLAWSVGTPVVLISGFSHPTTEFFTPYRVINFNSCCACWNDPQHQFDPMDRLWCPRHAGTERQFECTRLITADQVKATLRRIPGFGQYRGSAADPLPDARSPHVTLAL